MTSKLSAALKTDAIRPPTAFERFRAQINLVRGDVAKLLGDPSKVDKFIRVCLNAVQYTPAVLDADRKSLLLACLEAAQDGLMPDGNEAVFNVYKTKVTRGNREEWVEIVQYLPMAYGLVQKIYESGATFVDAVAVYEKDHFKYQRGDEPKIEHVPYDGEGDPGPLKAAYIVVRYPNLQTKREVMFRRDVEKVRSKSKAKDGLMWKEFYDQGAIKSVIHRINKQLPQSDRLRLALAKDNAAVGLAEIAAPAAAIESGTDLSALLEDKRLDQAIQEGRASAAREPVTVENEVSKTAEKKEAESGGGAKPPAEEKTAAAAPKPGDPGTPELKVKIIEKMTAASARDVLNIAKDDVDFFKWSDTDLKELMGVYVKRYEELKGTQE